MGGRGSQGGVFRIVYGGQPGGQKEVGFSQALSAWSRSMTQAQVREWIKTHGKQETIDLLRKKMFPSDAPPQQGDPIHVLNLMQMHELTPDAPFLTSLMQNKLVDVRAHAVYLLGVNGYKEGQEALIKALKDEDKWVQR